MASIMCQALWHGAGWGGGGAGEERDGAAAGSHAAAGYRQGLAILILVYPYTLISTST